MTPAEHTLWLMDQRMNRQGIKLDREACETLVDLAEDITAKLNEMILRETDGKIKTIGQVAKIAEFCGLTSAAKGTLEEALKEGNLTDKQTLVVKLRLAGAKSSASKIPKMLATLFDDDRSRGMLQFCGTHTKRWAGRGWQPHNLPRDSFKPDEFDECLKFARGGYDVFVKQYPQPLTAVSKCLRGLIIPDTGKEFIIADYSAIEARVLAWYAGQEDILQIYREGGDVYKETASSVFKKPTTDITDSERFLGKTLVLGSGYGMGVRKLHMDLESKGIELTRKEASGLTYGYRGRFDRVVLWWGAIINAFANALAGRDQTLTIGNLKFRRFRRNDVYVELATGNRIWFHDVKWETKIVPMARWNEELQIDEFEDVEMDTMTCDAHNGSRNHITTSILAENICSATAREIMARGMLRCEQAGYPPVMSVHDEVVLEIEKDFGSPDEVDKLLCEQPYWAKNLPLATEAFRSPRYTK